MEQYEDYLDCLAYLVDRRLSEGISPSREELTNIADGNSLPLDKVEQDYKDQLEEFIHEIFWD